MSRLALLRARRLVVLYGQAIAILLVVVGLLALAGAGWAYTHPTTTQVTDETHRQTVTANLSTEAVVVDNSTLYEAGQTLENQPVYLRGATPTPTLAVRTTVTDANRVTIDQRIELTYRATRDGVIFWENTTTLSRTETMTTSETVQMQTPLDIQAVQNRLKSLRGTIGSAGSVHVQLRLIVTYSTNRYNGTLSEPIPIQITDDWYRLGTPTATEQHSTPVSRTVDVPEQGWSATGPGVLGVFSLGLGLALATVSRRESSKLDQTDSEYELHQLRYSEWISTGTIPEDAGDRVIEVTSLESLIDIAIDSNTRTIYDSERECYAIIDGSTVYRFDPT